MTTARALVIARVAFTTWWMALLAAMCAWTTPARAQDPPQVTATIDPPEAEAGTPVTIQLHATSSGSTPRASDPALRLPNGVQQLGGVAIGTESQFSFGTGGATQRVGITATWHVAATRVGTFVLDGISVQAGDRRIAAPALRLVARPPGSMPAPQPAAPSNPFPPFPSFFGTPPDPEPARPAQQDDPKLALDAPLDPTLFLRAMADVREAVVGEQVTVDVWLYTRKLSIEAIESHEPNAPDFLRRDLAGEPHQIEVRTTTIGDRRWFVERVQSIAFFPLKAGDLEIGSMKMTFIGNGLRGRGLRGGVPVESAPMRVAVREPPADGRPAGYQVGDVGRFALSAIVDPRRSEIGGAVSVRLQVDGIGNVPASLHIPMQDAVEWLEPQTYEKIDVRNRRVGGTRALTYVVRPKKAGLIDLGSVELPFWDPEQGRYDRTRVDLGTITVTPSAPGTTGAAPPIASAEPVDHDPFAALPPPRAVLGEVGAWSPPLDDHASYWLVVLGPPFAVLGLGWSSSALRSLRARRAGARDEALVAYERAEDEMRARARGADARAVATGADRVIHAAIEVATGVRSRGVLLAELPRALASAGVPDAMANEACALLVSIDAVRYLPAGEMAAALPRDLGPRALAVAQSLRARRRERT